MLDEGAYIRSGAACSAEEEEAEEDAAGSYPDTTVPAPAPALAAIPVPVAAVVVFCVPAAPLPLPRKQRMSRGRPPNYKQRSARGLRHRLSSARPWRGNLRAGCRWDSPGWGLDAVGIGGSLGWPVVECVSVSTTCCEWLWLWICV